MVAAAQQPQPESQQQGAMSSPEEWYRSLPVITRGYMTAALIATATVQLELLSPYMFHLDFDALTQKFELWRLVTNFIFFGKFSMPFVFSLFFLVRYGRELEAKRFEGRASDYIWGMGLMGIVHMAVGYVLGVPFLAQAMLSSIVYIWSREYAEQVLSIFGLFEVQAFYFPWVLVAIRVLMGGSPVDDLIGIFAGHVYYFLEDVQGIKIVAPTILRDYLDAGSRPPQPNRNVFGNHAWGGGGQRLGG